MSRQLNLLEAPTNWRRSYNKAIVPRAGGRTRSCIRMCSGFAGSFLTFWFLIYNRIDDVAVLDVLKAPDWDTRL